MAAWKVTCIHIMPSSSCRSSLGTQVRNSWSAVIKIRRVDGMPPCAQMRVHAAASDSPTGPHS
eukprot:31556-Eustigmatos_ZCMA.PRE.1